MVILPLIKRIQQYLERKGSFYFSRIKAHRLRKQIVNERGYKIVNREKKRMLKSYAKKTFGASSFWPWLSLYTELRGEFKEGWMPNDYYVAHLLKKYNPQSIRISDYKTYDHQMFPDFALEPIVIKIGENFYDSNRRQITIDKAENILSDRDIEVVLKEDSGMGGHKVKFVASRKLNLKDYSHISSYVIQPVVTQHKSLKLISAKSVNTLRVLTYLNNEGSIEIKYVELRFGVGDSRVDNVSSGGGFCFINSKGNLDDTAYNDLGIPIGSKHPDSGTSFKSVTIPNYEKLLRECIAAHKMFPYVKFIGWDVAVQKSGELVLLEWNLRPSIWMPEALRGPFFSKEFMGNGI